MILPGHIAAAVLCHRHLKIDLRLSLVAGLLPDVVDKILYYGFRIVPSSRVIMHTLWAWLGTTLLLGLVAWLWSLFGKGQIRIPYKGWIPERWPRWAVLPASWFCGYGVHLLCDSPLTGGKLPFLYPFRTYELVSLSVPMGFLFGFDTWPVHTLVVEGLLVAFTLIGEVRRYRAKHHVETSRPAA